MTIYESITETYYENDNGHFTETNYHLSMEFALKYLNFSEKEIDENKEKDIYWKFCRDTRTTNGHTQHIFKFKIARKIDYNPTSPTFYRGVVKNGYEIIDTIYGCSVEDVKSKYLEKYLVWKEDKIVLDDLIVTGLSMPNISIFEVTAKY